MTAGQSGDVLARAAAGDPDAFTDLVRAHQAMVYSIALHCLRERGVAEEVAQEVFLALHQNLRQVESPEHLVRWLRRVAANRCIDEARRRRPRVGLEEVPEPTAAVRGADPWQEQRLRSLVAGLPPRFRALVVLRYQEDLEPVEIAAALGIPVGTVKSGLHRAVALLRGKMGRVGARSNG